MISNENINEEEEKDQRNEEEEESLELLDLENSTQKIVEEPVALSEKKQEGSSLPLFNITPTTFKTSALDIKEEELKLKSSEDEK